MSKVQTFAQMSALVRENTPNLSSTLGEPIVNFLQRIETWLANHPEKLYLQTPDIEVPDFLQGVSFRFYRDNVETFSLIMRCMPSLFYPAFTISVVGEKCAISWDKHPSETEFHPKLKQELLKACTREQSPRDASLVIPPNPPIDILSVITTKQPFSDSPALKYMRLLYSPTPLWIQQEKVPSCETRPITSPGVEVLKNVPSENVIAGIESVWKQQVTGASNAERHGDNPIKFMRLPTLDIEI